MNLSMPVLWVLLPLAVAGITVIFRNYRLFSLLLSSTLSFGLAALAFFFPEEMSLNLGPLTLSFIESLDILGRQISIPVEILPFIALIFGANGLWALSSGITGTPHILRASSLAITALLTAALGIEPFLYAALLIQAVVLISIPMLSVESGESPIGVLRYLTLQTLAMPLILFAGWLLSGVETLPPESDLIGQSAMVLGLGFALLLGIFPFHSWVPMVSERSHPSVFSFLFFIVPAAILLFSLNFFNRYPFLRGLEDLAVTLRGFGALMIVLGGLWTAFQENLKRAFGFSSLTETGFSLLALSLIPQGGVTWLLLIIPVRALGFWLWGYTLTLIETHTGSLTFDALRGFARRYPILSFGLLLAQLSIAGLPLLAAFPVKIALLTALRSAGSAYFTWSFIGSLGLFLFTLRLLAIFVTPDEEIASRGWALNEKTYEYLPILAAILFLILMGVFPETFLAGIMNTLTAFPQLQ